MGVIHAVLLIFLAVALPARANPPMNIYDRLQQANQYNQLQFQQRMQQYQMQQQLNAPRFGFGGVYQPPMYGGVPGPRYGWPVPQFGPSPEELQRQQIMRQQFEQQQREAEWRRQQEQERQLAIARQQQMEQERQQAERARQEEERQKALAQQREQERQEQIEEEERQRQAAIEAKKEAKRLKLLAKQQEKERRRQEKLARAEQRRQAEAARQEEIRQAEIARQQAIQAAWEFDQFQKRLNLGILWAMVLGAGLLFLPGYREYSQHRLFAFKEWSFKPWFFLSALCLGSFVGLLQNGLSNLDEGNIAAFAGVLGIPAAFYVPGFLLLSYNYLHYLFVPHPAEEHIQRLLASRTPDLEEAKRMAHSMPFQPSSGDPFDAWRAANHARRLEALTQLLNKQNEAMEAARKNQLHKNTPDNRNRS